MSSSAKSRKSLFRWAAATLVCGLIFAPSCRSQSWKPLLQQDQAIDWSGTGAGAHSPRPACVQLNANATLAQINAALASCAAGHAVVLEPGVYPIPGSIRIPSRVTLRGAGADRTILDATGTGQAIVALGYGSVPFLPRLILSGANRSSTTVTVASTHEIVPGKYLAIAERNDPAFVTSAGSGGQCTWCDGGWSRDGDLARGQIVEVVAVNGDTLSIRPALYADYSHAPVAVPFDMSTVEAGVEDLQLRAHNTGYDANVAMTLCARCWISGVASNYADGDHVSIQWGFRDEVSNSYFSNAFQHLPGAHEADIDLALKTSASLIENNIIERTHTAVMLQWGAAGNVIAYNYTTGEFDSGSPNVVVGGIDFHGAHPQFNLIEGNVLTAFYADSIWGSSSHTTAFRNWIVGTNHICIPLIGQGPVDCERNNGHFGFQAARAVQFAYTSTRNNFIGNLLGSAHMQSLRGAGHPISQTRAAEYPQARPYEAAILWSFGYGSANDDGTGDGCGGGVAPCHAALNSRTQLLHGNYENMQTAASWLPSLPRKLPASFYLSAKPDWWGELPFPAIGPDVTGGAGPGAHSHGNPAQTCYLRMMHGADGGQGSPLPFNAARCYGGDVHEPASPRAATSKAR